MKLTFTYPPKEEAFRLSLLSEAVWEKLSPPITDAEVLHAMANLKPMTSVSMAIQDCLRRRDLASRGRLRGMDRTTAAENDKYKPEESE